jgi:DNA polymerase-3 subunit alpha
VLGVDEAGQPQKEHAIRARAIRYGLGAVRSMGDMAVMNILAARERGPFKDLFDFCSRIDRRMVNKRAIEALIRAGAFDDLHLMGREGRAQLVTGVALAVQSADEAENHADQVGPFDGMAAKGDDGDSIAGGWATGGAHGLESPETPVYSARDCLLEERLALGYCFSGSLFDSIADELRRFAPMPLLKAMPSREPIRIAGVVTGSRGQMTRRGMMRVIELDDGSGRMEVTVFNELYVARKHMLKVDEPLVMSAKIDNDEYSGGLRGSAVEILTLAEARLRYAKGVRIALALRQDESFQSFLQRLKETLAQRSEAAPGPLGGRSTGGACPLFLEVMHAGQRCELQLGQEYGVQPSDEVLGRLTLLAGEGRVGMV